MSVGVKPFRVELVTPDRAFEPLECTFVALPAWDGEVGILANRAPLVCRLKAGLVRIETGGGWQRFQISGGFAEAGGNVLTVLADQAQPAEKPET